MRGILVVAGLALTGGRAAAQPPLPEKVSTGPTSYGWPGATPPTSPVGGVPAPYIIPPYAAGPPPVPLLEAPPSVFAPGNTNCPPVADHILTSGGREPLPGSLEDQFNRELDARRGFRYCTWNNTRITAFPNTLLWTPPLAEKRQPRMAVILSTFNNYTNDWTLDNSIGGTVGLLRGEPAGSDTAVQLDLFAVVHTRLSPEDLIATDYRFGFPVTFRRGDWQAKISYEHTSTHLGDEITQNTGRPPIDFIRDEVVFGVGRYFPEYQLRLYGTASYAFFQQITTSPDAEDWRFDAGFEWVCPVGTGFAGAPFVAAHVESSGAVKYNASVTAQAGWMFRNPFQRLANLRVYGEYYEGRSQFGQFYLDREKFFAVGLAGDF